MQDTDIIRTFQHYYAVTVDGDDQQLLTFTILYTN